MKNANQIIRALLKDIRLYRLSNEADTPLKEAIADQLDATVADAVTFLAGRKSKAQDVPAADGETE